MYNFEIKPTLLKVLKKIKSKDKKSYDNIMTKIKEIISSTQEGLNHYKNLKNPLNHLKRVHVNTHFVLLFSVDEKEKLISFQNYKHHDKAYS